MKNNEVEQDSVENPFSTGDTIMKRNGWKMDVPPLDNWPMDSIKFLIAEEVEEIGKQIINTFREDLKGCNIGYVFKKKATSNATGTVLGQIKAENELQKVLHGLDAVVVIGFDRWKDANPDAKFRLIHHELAHLVRDIDTDRVGTISHDVEEFSSTIRIFGPNQDSHVRFISGYNDFAKVHGSKVD